MKTQLENTEQANLRKNAAEWYTKWVNDRPFEDNVFVIQTIVDFFYKNENNDALQEIRDVLEETGLPLSLADQWLVNNSPVS